MSIEDANDTGRKFEYLLDSASQAGFLRESTSLMSKFRQNQINKTPSGSECPQESEGILTIVLQELITLIFTLFKVLFSR